MQWTAAIVTSQHEHFAEIVATLAKTELNIRYHHCSAHAELEQLLLTHVDLILYAPDLPTPGSPYRQVAELLLLADQKHCPVCFISNSAHTELVQSGLIPADSHHLDLGQPPQLVQNQLVTTVSSYRPAIAEPSRVPRSQEHRKNQGCEPPIFEHLLDQETSRAALTGRPFAILHITSGDNQQSPLWQELTSRISHEIRSSDTLCYYAGIGLLLLLPETSSELAEKLAVRLHAHNSAIPGYDNAPLAVTPITLEQLQRLLPHKKQARS